MLAIPDAEISYILFSGIKFCFVFNLPPILIFSSSPLLITKTCCQLEIVPVAVKGRKYFEALGNLRVLLKGTPNIKKTSINNAVNKAWNLI